MLPRVPGEGPSRRPLIWGGLFSGLGSLSAILIAGRLFAVFTPQAILSVAFDSSFVLIVLSASTIWVLLATLARIPVSTTHALLGAIVFQGILLFGFSGFHWDFLGLHVVLPLAGGPIAALVGVYMFEQLVHRPPAKDKSEKVPKWASFSHWGSAAATAYARGINDAPKMAVLGIFFLVAYPTDKLWISYSIVAVAVVVGSLILGHRVAATLTAREVPMNHGQRFRAGIATAALVSAGAVLGAPLSTTHMHAGASAGGSGLKEAIRSALRGMILPWLVTLPATGLLAIAMATIGPQIFALG
jgi:PiT family inorganic phosphate transporter